MHDAVSICFTNYTTLEYNKSFQWQHGTILIYNLEIVCNKQTSKNYMCWDLFLEDAPLFSYATTKSLSLGWLLTGGLSVFIFDMYCIKWVEKKNYYYYYYYFLLCALAHIIPIYLLKERVITHDQRPLRVHLLTLVEL